MCSLAVYLATLAPTVTSEDSGEFICAAYQWGVAHPPGYPLWTMLCGGFLRAVSLGNIAWRANLFSAFCSSLSVVVLSAFLVRLRFRWPVAMAGALVWGFSGTLWSQSVITEVYGLNALLTALLLWTFLNWYQTQNTKWLIWASLLFGLGMSNHQTIGFVALATGVWTLLLKPKLLANWRLVLICMGVFAVGLLPYLYLPLRANAHPPMNWGDPSTSTKFWKHVARSQYGSTAPLAVKESRSWSRFGQQMRYVGEVVVNDLTWPVAVLAALGLIVMTWRQFRMALLIWLLLFSGGVLFVLMSNIDLDRTFRFAMTVFLIPLSLSLVIPLAWLLNQVLEKLVSASRVMKYVVTGLVMLLPLLPIVTHYSRCNYSNYWYAEDHARNTLACLLPNAIIFPSGDHSTFPLMYLTMVEGQRPDVRIADKYGYIDPALLDEIAAKVGEPVRLQSESEKEAFIIRNAHRPIYYTTRKNPPVDNAAMVPVGITYHLLPDTKTIDRDEPWTSIRYRNGTDSPTVEDLGASHILFDYLFFMALDQLRKGDSDQALKTFDLALQHMEGIKEPFNNVGSALAEHGFTEQAIDRLEHARSLDKSYAMPRWNLVHLYEKQENLEKVKTLLLELTQITPDDPRPYGKLGFLYLNVFNDPDQARHYFGLSLQKNPHQPQILKALLELGDRK